MVGLTVGRKRLTIDTVHLIGILSLGVQNLEKMIDEYGAKRNFSVSAFRQGTTDKICFRSKQGDRKFLRTENLFAALKVTS